MTVLDPSKVSDEYWMIRRCLWVSTGWAHESCSCHVLLVIHLFDLLGRKNNFIRRRNLMETSPVSVVWHSRLSELFVLCNKTRLKCSNSSEACQWRCSIVLRLLYHFIALGGVHSSSADVLRYFACSSEPTDDADDDALRDDDHRKMSCSCTARLLNYKTLAVWRQLSLIVA